MTHLKECLGSDCWEYERGFESFGGEVWLSTKYVTRTAEKKGEGF